MRLPFTRKLLSIATCSFITCSTYIAYANEAAKHTEFTQRNISPDAFVKCPLLHVTYETPDTKRMTFGSGVPVECSIGDCLIAQGKPAERSATGGLEFQRAYIPIEINTEKGTFDILVQRVKKGPVSTWLHALTKGEHVQFKGPFPYVPNLKQAIHDSNKIVLIADGVVGIAAVYPIVQAITQQMPKSISEKKDIQLIYSANTVSDFALADKIIALQEDLVLKQKEMEGNRRWWSRTPTSFTHTMNTYFTVIQGTWGWKGGIGPFHNKLLLQQVVGNSSLTNNTGDKCLIIIAADNKITKGVTTVLEKELNWSKQNVLELYG